MSQSDSDKRGDTRLPFEVEVEIRADEQTLRATTRDISLSGLYVSTAEILAIGTLCEVQITGRSGSFEMSIDGQAEVVRLQPEPRTGAPGMGLRFLEVDAP